MKKKIIVLFILLLLTGCKAKYGLQINFGGSVIETGNILIDKNLVGLGGTSNNTDIFLEDLLEKYGATKYRLKTKINETNYIGYKFYHRYNNLEYYSNQSPAINLLYDYVNYSSLDGFSTIQSSDKSKIDTYNSTASDVPTKVEEINISIALPYKVIENNATTIDRENNIYTWVIVPGAESEKIKLSYRDSELFTNNPLYLARYVSPYIYIVVLIAVVAIIVIIVIKGKMRYINKL